jgi:sugar phosphate isomerase/epimerase
MRACSSMELKSTICIPALGHDASRPKGDPDKTIAFTARHCPIAVQAAKLKCQVALYNHGGWFGEPENQIAIIETLKKDGITNVGMVYNLHHGHEHLAHFPELLAKMKPYLLALNLNGMTKDGDKSNKKILPLGQGELDLQLLKLIRDSGYAGLIGILNHTDEEPKAASGQPRRPRLAVPSEWQKSSPAPSRLSSP